MNRLKTIEFNRLANMLVYFAANTEDCGVTKANKLFFYADCQHLIEHGRTITRETYIKLPQGPVPQDIYTHIQSLVEILYPRDEGLCESEVQGYVERLADFIDVEKELKYDYSIHKIIPKQEFNPEWFSESERQVLQAVSERYRNKTAKELSDLSHKERAYIEAEASRKINLFIYAQDHLSPDRLNEVRHIDETIRAMELNY